MLNLVHDVVREKVFLEFFAELLPLVDGARPLPNLSLFAPLPYYSHLGQI